MRTFGFTSLLLLLCSLIPCFGWQFSDSTSMDMSSPGIVVLDPDNFSRDDLLNLKKAGLKPVAWLNLSEIEDWRIISVDAKEKDYAFSDRFSPEELKLAKFYSTDFWKIAESRVSEYMMKGFSGLVFANVGYYSLVSNSPINRNEMWYLIENLAKKASTLCVKPLILVHNGLDYIVEIKNSKLVDGLVTQGLFNSFSGRHTYKWQRQEVLENIEPLLKNGKLVLTAEMADKTKQVSFIRETCEKEGLDFCIQKLPLKMNRRKIDDFQK